MPWIGNEHDVETADFLWDYGLPVLLAISVIAVAAFIWIAAS